MNSTHSLTTSGACTSRACSLDFAAIRASPSLAARASGSRPRLGMLQSPKSAYLRPDDPAGGLR
jgi:hypothetical protein